MPSIPTPSLQTGPTGYAGPDDQPNQRRSAHVRPFPGRPPRNTQIYEGTNQVQLVVIAKALLG